MNALVDYFLQHHDKLLYLLAGVSLVIELTILGLSGPLLFFAIASGITGLFVTLGLVSSWEYEVLSIGILSILFAIILWKPLKNFQGSTSVKDNSSDMIGQVVPVTEDVSHIGGSIRYSGINWQARLDDSASSELLKNGLRVEISAVEGNVMIVRPLSPQKETP